MIETKNQELNEELQQERVEHERSMAQLAEAREAHAELEEDVVQLKKQLERAQKDVKDAKVVANNVNQYLSIRSGGSRIGKRPSAGARPLTAAAAARPGARPGGSVIVSSANKYSTMRDMTLRGVTYDLSGELQNMKAQKAELVRAPQTAKWLLTAITTCWQRDKLERERKIMIEVMALISQLNIVVGTHDVAAKLSTARTPTTVASNDPMLVPVARREQLKTTNFLKNPNNLLFCSQPVQRRRRSALAV